MRILLTTDTVGGVWTFTKELVAGLLEDGHSVALVSLGRAPASSQTEWCNNVLVSHGKAFRFAGSSVPLEWMPQNADAYSAAEPLLLRMVQEFSPDLLHASQFCFGRLPADIPRVITAHSDVLSWAAACHPPRLEPSEWLAQYCSLAQQGLDAADAVVAPTQWMLDALRKNFTFAAPVAVIHNGRSLPDRDESQSRRLEAVTAGRIWDPGKNISILKNVNAPLKISVAGEFDPSSQETFPGNISLLGLLDEAGLLKRFWASSLYIATSVYEPFGLAPLEAALCGCAVVANDIASFREVWGEAALYFDGVEELNRLLGLLATDPARLELARQNSQWRAKQLTRARMTNAYVTLYEQVLSRCSNPAPKHAAYA